MRNNALRGWWKPWTWSTRRWAIAIVLCFLASPFVTRWMCLWMVPDVVMPFDVEAIIPPEVPEDEDAFKVYENVLKILAGQQTDSSGAAPDATATKSLDDVLQRMLTNDERGLSEYIRAGNMKRAGGPSLKTATFSVSLSLHQQLRQIVRHYNSLATSFNESDIEKAWACHRANLQCSIHCEQPGFAISCLVGYAVRAICAESLVNWASNPSIPAERLRAARAEIVELYARRLPLSTIETAEYLSARNTVEQLEAADVLWESLIRTPPGAVAPQPNALTTFLRRGKMAVFWCAGEPEIAARIFRQLLVNHGSEMNKPFHQRRHSVLLKTEGQYIFDFDPNQPRASGQLSPEMLAGILESKSPLLRLGKEFLPHLAQIDQARRRNDTRLSAITLVYAAQEYQRIHGEFPESIDQLVPAFIEEVPFDPLIDEKTPMKYRREPDGTAVVWSIGWDGKDNNGNVSTVGQILDLGFIIRLNQPAASEKPTEPGPNEPLEPDPTAE